MTLTPYQAKYFAYELTRRFHSGSNEHLNKALVDAKQQYVSFIDPKGLRQIQGLADPKIALHQTIKSSIQPKLNDPDIKLSSFIISNTPFERLSH
jgi:hypothetical protein